MSPWERKLSNNPLYVIFQSNNPLEYKVQRTKEVVDGYLENGFRKDLTKVLFDVLHPRSTFEAEVPQFNGVMALVKAAYAEKTEEYDQIAKDFKLYNSRRHAASKMHTITEHKRRVGTAGVQVLPQVLGAALTARLLQL